MVVPVEQLCAQLCDARRRTYDLVADLNDEQLLGPRLSIVNPLLWEIGHVAWFQEKWILQHCAGHQPVLGSAGAVYDSAVVPHDTRWDFLPSRTKTLDYVQEVLDRVMQWLQQREPTVEEAYFVLLSVFHEDMHTEAFTYTRQTLGFPAPRFSGVAESDFVSSLPELAGPLPGDVEVPGGIFWLGATPEVGFVFDNEKWAHRVEVQPFAIARGAVTQEEFAAFVEAGGYRRPEFWTAAGRRWRQASHADHPLHWQREAAGRWLRRDFDQWVPLEPHRPVLHVNWFEADAYCRWAGRRLPTEIEWEVSAAAEPDAMRRHLTQLKRRFPWGNSLPSMRHANLNWHRMGCLDVAALPDGDSAFGCRQMIGNVWEWTASYFLPYPGFIADPYKEYSVPWFGTHKVLRGGCWVTRDRLLRNTWRNFYLPDRRDIWAGFRTCALEP